MASISVGGVVRRVSTGEAARFTGLFSAQFNVPDQIYLATIVSGGSGAQLVFRDVPGAVEPRRA